MKIKMIVCSALAVVSLTGCVNIENEGYEHHGKSCEQCECQEHHHNQAKWHAEAKVSKEIAEQTALAKVPNGKIRGAELEKEQGKLQWSFDIATPDAKEITEVNVDAITGDVISVSKESAEGEAREGDKD